MIIALLIVSAVLLVALYISVMAVWWQQEQGLATKTLSRHDAVHAFNKAVRLGRRSWYSSIRHSKRIARWGNDKATKAFVTIFPKSKPAFADQDLLTGLQHGPSSYFLAHLTKKTKRTVARKPKKLDLSV